MKQFSVVCMFLGVTFATILATVASDAMKPPTAEEREVIDDCVKAAMQLVTKIDKFSCRTKGRFESLNLKEREVCYETEFAFDWSEDFETNGQRISFVSQLISMDKPFPRIGNEFIKSFGNINRSFDTLGVNSAKFAVGDIVIHAVGKPDVIDEKRVVKTAFSPFGVAYAGYGATNRISRKMTIDYIDAFRNYIASETVKQVKTTDPYLAAQWWFPMKVLNQDRKPLEGHYSAIEIVFDKERLVPVAWRNFSCSPDDKIKQLDHESKTEWEKHEDYWVPVKCDCQEPIVGGNGFRRTVAEMNWKFDKDVSERCFDKDDLGKAEVLTLFVEDNAAK